MAKETFCCEKLNVNVGTIGHIDHGKTTLTAAILRVQAEKGLAEYRAYADIAKGGIVRDKSKTVTILGRLYKSENAIVVEEFESEGGDDAWDALPTGSKSGLQVL